MMVEIRRKKSEDDVGLGGAVSVLGGTEAQRQPTSPVGKVASS